ncbi:MAG: arsenate reductase (glutaredoxin) [Ferrimonas sp.]
MTEIWHNPRCSKSRETLALLNERGIEATVIPYLEQPPSTEKLLRAIMQLGGEPLALVRTKEALYKELQLANQNLTAEQWAQLLHQHPKLIERPLVIHQQQAAIGRPPEAVLVLFQ